MMLKSDFWPPVQGGWAAYSGVLLPSDEVRQAFATSGIPLPKGEHFSTEDDETDVWGHFEDLATEAKLPEPDYVFYIRRPDKFAKGLPETLSEGFYVYWPTSKWEASAALREFLAKCSLVGPIDFQYRFPVRLPIGIEILLFVLALPFIFFLLRTLNGFVAR